MSNITNFLPFVKEQISLQQKLAIKFADNAYRNKMHIASMEKFIELANCIEKTDNYITELEKRPKPITTGAQFLNLSFQEIQGLPDELMEELSITDSDKQEFIIVNLIDECGSVANLDRILVGLYKKNGEIHKRSALITRLYRMMQKGLIFGVPSKKGVYSTHPLTNDDVDRLFGQYAEKETDITE